MQALWQVLSYTQNHNVRLTTSRSHWIFRLQLFNTLFYIHGLLARIWKWHFISYLILATVILESIKMFSYRNTFLLFQISKWVMDITTFTIALISSLIKIPAKTESLLSVILDSNTLLMNCFMSSHIPDNLEHVYNKCSTFSSWMPHILQIPFENIICLNLISVFIHP